MLEILLLGGKSGGGGDFDGAPARGRSADKPKSGGDFAEFPEALEPEDDDLPF